MDDNNSLAISYVSKGGDRTVSFTLNLDHTNTIGPVLQALKDTLVAMGFDYISCLEAHSYQGNSFINDYSEL